MEQYLDAKVKRFVQKKLFSHIPKTKTILGLAGNIWKFFPIINK